MIIFVRYFVDVKQCIFETWFFVKYVNKIIYGARGVLIKIG